MAKCAHLCPSKKNVFLSNHYNYQLHLFPSRVRAVIQFQLNYCMRGKSDDLAHFNTPFLLAAATLRCPTLDRFGACQVLPRHGQHVLIPSATQACTKSAQCWAAKGYSSQKKWCAAHASSCVVPHTRPCMWRYHTQACACGTSKGSVLQHGFLPNAASHGCDGFTSLLQ